MSQTVTGLVTVSRDVTQSRLLEQEVLEITEREQRRIGSDLHDGLGQELTGLGLMIHALEADLAREDSPHLGQVRKLGEILRGAFTSARSLARALAPRIRVNAISPATVVKGSTMFPRDRVIASLKKYNLLYDENAGDDDLRDELAKFYARRTLTAQPIDPKDCAQAILFLAGPNTPCTTGHIFPVDGGLTEAFLR